LDPIIILQAGVASGTVLLFATIGEILTERSGVLNINAGEGAGEIEAARVELV